jgi:hypothetical protein
LVSAEFASALAGAAAQTQEPRPIAAPTSILVVTLVVDEAVVVVMITGSCPKRSASSLLAPVSRPRHPDFGNTG